MIIIQTSLKLAFNGTIKHKPSLMLIVAWYRTGDKASIEKMMAKFIDAYARLQASVY